MAVQVVNSIEFQLTFQWTYQLHTTAFTALVATSPLKSLLKFNSIDLQEFRVALAKHLSDSPDAAGLIRKHDKNFTDADFRGAIQ